MDAKVDLLVKKLYEEGTAKAEQDAKEILSDAKKEAETILQVAKKDAKDILENAQAESQRLKQSIIDDCKRLLRDSLDIVSEKIGNLVSKDLVERELKNLTSNNNVMGQILLACASKFSVREGIPSIEAVVSPEIAKEFGSLLAKETKARVGEGLKIIESKSGKSGFALQDQAGTWKIGFDYESLVEFLKPYATRRVRELLEAAK